jgi:hypothetical protein
MKIFITVILLSILSSLSADQKSKLEEKLDNIKISGVQFFETPLPDALMEIQRLSKQFDLTESNPLEKGVQLIYKSFGSDTPPNITIALSPMSLKNSIKFICEMASWHYHVAENRIVISKFPHGLGENPLRTEFYEVTQGSLNKMIGVTTKNQDPFAPKKANDTAPRLKEFFQSNGIIFDSASGHKFAFDGFQIIVTHDREKLKKIARILREHDLDIPLQISVASILIEAPVRSLAKHAKALKIPQADTEKFPFISSEIANKLIDSMQASNDVKILHTPSVMVLDGKKASINSGLEYHFNLAEESSNNSAKPNTDNINENKKPTGIPRNIGLSLVLTPRIKKYQVIEIDFLSQFTRLIDDKIKANGEKEPTFWSTRFETSIQIGPDQTFISLASSSEEGFELISFLTAQIKR